MLIREIWPQNDGFSRFDVRPIGGYKEDVAYHLTATECLVRGNSQAQIEVGCALDDTITDESDISSNPNFALVSWLLPYSGYREIMEYDQVITFREKFPFYTFIAGAEPDCAIMFVLYYEEVKLTAPQVIALNRKKGIARYAEIFE